MNFQALELERALRRLERGCDAARVAEELSRRLMNKLLHAPTRALRQVRKGETTCTRTS